MAKRFIDTSFFKDPFVRGLQGACKGLYLYLFLDCSNSGLWHVELDVARLRCGVADDISNEMLITMFSDKIIPVENGEKWLIKDFIDIQHNGQLKENNKAHISAIEELRRYDLLNEVEPGAFVLKTEKEKPLASPLNGSYNDPIVIVKVKEEGNSKDKSKSKKAEIENLEIILPFLTETFKTQWQLWKAYKAKEHNFKYKSEISEQASLNELSNLSGGNESKAIAIMNQSMTQGWKGFFELKKSNSNGPRGNNSTRSDGELKESANNAVNEMFGISKSS